MADTKEKGGWLTADEARQRLEGFIETNEEGTLLCPECLHPCSSEESEEVKGVLVYTCTNEVCLYDPPY